MKSLTLSTMNHFQATIQYDSQSIDQGSKDASHVSIDNIALMLIERQDRRVSFEHCGNHRELNNLIKNLIFNFLFELQGKTAKTCRKLKLI